MLPLYTVAASFVPSAEEAIPDQLFVAPMEVTSVQVAPLLLEVHMLPLYTVAASFVPSAEDVIPTQFFVAPTEVSSVQVAAAYMWSMLKSKTKQTNNIVFITILN